MSNIITGGVLRVCSFVVKCFREIGGEWDTYCFSVGLALLIFIYSQHYNTYVNAVFQRCG